MLFSPMKSAVSFEIVLQTSFTHSRNPSLSNHFPIPKTAQRRNPRKTNTLAHSSQKHGGVWVFFPNREKEKLLRGNRRDRRILRAQQIHQNLVQLCSHL